MALDRIVQSIAGFARMMALAPLVLVPLALTAPAPAEAASLGVQTCTVVLFVEVCTGGDVGTGGASPAPAPMLGGSILSLIVLGGFVALRHRMATPPRNADRPAIED